ncbi:MAG TPA: hypothetical protein VE152_04025, partial [Acidimicrobiales bacterium]|nr:hypothetical protein [Acidimicrobiales bacterium]
MITGIACEAMPLASPMRNAYISFAAMTTSVVAVHDDAGLVGYGFNSNGRYDQCGILRSRLIPRLLAAPPDQVLDGEGRVDPEAAWGVMLADEKPGGHGDRAVAAGAVDMALWDLAAKEAAVPLPHLLAGRYAWAPPEEAVAVYAAGGYYYPDRGEEALAEELRGYLDRGYTRVKMKVGGAPVDTDRRRVEAALDVVG